MKKVYMFDETEINNLNKYLRQINHDADVIQQNKNNPEHVNGYAERIKTFATEVIKLMKD
ncbi:MAG: hypothetical protein K0Q87_5027 [Neobacillus sp.]|nr:hypothetical protein [Neobacillus sp.]